VEDRFLELMPVHELGKFQRNTLLLTALSTSVPASPSAHRCQDWHHQHPPSESCAWWKGKTLDEIWRKKTMRRRNLTMKGLGFSLASWCTLFISNLSWAFMNYRSN
jgi:hypothetical protein